MYAIVDDDDYEYLIKYNWTAITSRKTLYAIRSLDGKRMHRIIMKSPDNLQVDHINGNGLDNRKCNLRNCTPSINQRNRGVNKNNKCGIKGAVYKSGKYQVTICLGKKQFYLGRYKNKGEAILSYEIGKLLIW